MYDAALENAAHLYLDLHQDVALDAWLEAEEWRASSLRSALAEGQGWRARVGPEYWGVLAQYRAFDASSLRHPSSEGARRLEHLRVRLDELESFAGVLPKVTVRPESFRLINTLNPYRNSLRRGQTLISFQLGERVSHRWILGRSGLSWTRLPPRAEIADLGRRFRNSVESGSSSAKELGLQLGSMLFSDLNGDAEQARFWILVLDDALFQVPFPALLRSGPNGVDRYLIEQHSLASVPGAWSLTARPAEEWKGDFVGVADAVYNSADPRWARVASRESNRPDSAVRLLLTGRTTAETPSAQLPRLPATLQEVRASASAWNSGRLPVILTGPGANLRGLNAALNRRPAIVHFSAHVIPNPNALDRAYIALSLAADGVPELLSTNDVVHLKTDGALVVLSGCHSAVGLPVNGSGLIGLERAWLMSGAAAVVASLWPTPDDNGLIFESFYRELRRVAGRAGPSGVQSAAEALGQAQLEMLRTNSWRAIPKYWATYQITGRTN